MWRVLYSYRMIAGVIVALVLAAGCADETNQSTVIPTSGPPTEATEFARSPNTTIAALQTVQGGATVTREPVDGTRSPTGTPETSGGSGEQAKQESAPDEPGNATGTPDSRSRPTEDTSAMEVDYLEFEGAKTTFFSVNSSNTVLPEDILQEINVFTAGMERGLYCGKQGEQPFIYDDLIPAFYEPLDVIWICTNGWQPGEVVTMTLTKPDGVVVTDARDWLGYELALDDPLGEYEIVFRGQSVELRETVNVALPEEPRLYIRDDELILYNFEPGEAVRLLAYESSEFKAWALFQTDREGNLIVKLDPATIDGIYTYVVVGEESGEVFPYSRYPYSRYKLTGATVLLMTAIERGGPYLMISGVMINRPEATSLERITSLWSFAPYRNLAAPGANTYDVHLTSLDRVLWRFPWCARDKETLRTILAPITLRFLVNGVEIPMYMFQQNTELNPSGGSCQWWSILIRFLPDAAVSELAIEYDLATAINDGTASYPAGTYRHVIRVSLDQ